MNNGSTRSVDRINKLMQHFLTRISADLDAIILHPEACNVFKINHNSPHEVPFAPLLMQDWEGHQENLPKLPLPPLDETLEKYLKMMQPLVSSESQWVKTKRIVENLLNSREGKELQQRLIDYNAKAKTSYVASFWDDMYLTGRYPIVINSNVVLAFQSDPERRTAAARASALILSAAKFIHAAHYDLLEPCIERNRPLCMVQLKRLFSSSRIPQQGRDRLILTPESRHVIVLCKRHIWKLNIFNDDGSAVSQSHLLNQIQQIIAISNDLPLGPGVGAFTGIERDEWAFARTLLLEHNASQLSVTDSALMAIVLLDEAADYPSMNRLARDYLCGDTGNRWFDKSLQLIFSTDGECGINAEHSWGDGHTIQRFMQQVYYDSRGLPTGYKPLAGPPLGRSSHEVPELIHFGLPADGKLVKMLQSAETKVLATFSQLDSATLQIGRYGRKKLDNRSGLNADAVFQYAFQLAYYRLHRKLGSSYEAASMRHFRFGRTENIRPLTPFMATQVLEFGSHLTAHPDALMASLKQISKSHAQQCKEALIGKGIDRHIFSLRNLVASSQVAGPVEDFFQDTTYLREFSTHILSTSTLGSDAFQFGMFGPVATEGYGVAYRTGLEDMTFVITNWKRCDTSSQAYADQLSKTLDQIFSIL